jgi:hypothetical protein
MTATARKLTVDSGLEVGDYTLAVVVKKGSVFNSKSVSLTETAAPGTN